VRAVASIALGVFVLTGVVAAAAGGKPPVTKEGVPDAELLLQLDLLRETDLTTRRELYPKMSLFERLRLLEQLRRLELETETATPRKGATR
jgi:hypothetical protein